MIHDETMGGINRGKRSSKNVEIAFFNYPIILFMLLNVFIIEQTILREEEHLLYKSTRLKALD